MSYLELERKFTSAVPHVNCMTPKLVGYYEIPNGVVELSYGTFMDDSLWGVTVVRDGEHDTSDSKCFSDKGRAESYIEELADALT